MEMEAICFTYFEQIRFNKESMQDMKRLRILYIYDDHPIHHFLSSIDSVDIPNGSLEYLSNNLRWFVWDHYPWVSLPEKFEPPRLINLDLRWSLLHDLWTGIKDLPSLRRLKLGLCRKLKKTPDFTRMPNLEYLDLMECTSPEEVHPSLKCRRKLIWLNLHGCVNLERFPYVNVESLEYMNIIDAQV
ncbi:hypothetical protein P3L10_033235 [Capsicum annuum]